MALISDIHLPSVLISIPFMDRNRSENHWARPFKNFELQENFRVKDRSSNGQQSFKGRLKSRRCYFYLMLPCASRALFQITPFESSENCCRWWRTELKQRLCVRLSRWAVDSGRESKINKKVLLLVSLPPVLRPVFGCFGSRLLQSCELIGSLEQRRLDC